MAKFYIHDRTRGCVGNSLVWWRKGHYGYTCDLRDAHVFDESELAERLTAGDLTAYRCEDIDQLVEHHIDMQSVSVRGLRDPAECREGDSAK